MSKYKYTDEEIRLNKILKMNQDISISLLKDIEKTSARMDADSNINKSLELLKSSGKNTSNAVSVGECKTTLEHRLVIEEWDEIARQANEYLPEMVGLEDIMSDHEIEAAFVELDEINRNFSKKTSIINKTDLSFLAIATALQVTKSLLFPYIAKQFDYGKSFDKNDRLPHNDPSIKDTQKKANEKFRTKNLKRHEEGRWIQILYQPPVYDITTGSKDLGINMGGAYHRMHTLGHDPILGWLFGTLNILTDIITLNNFQSYRVSRKPMRIIDERVPLSMMFEEAYGWAKLDYLNLPAAVFAQAQHFKSDKYTRLGLPIPILSSINEEFASRLYKSNYDALCFSRDLKIVGASFAVTKMFDIIISLVHGLFREEDEPKELFEVRTRKILLISNSIASTSTVISASITSNPKNLDIGSLLNTVTHLFADMRFIAKIKREYIEGEISDRLQQEINEIDKLFEEI